MLWRRGFGKYSPWMPLSTSLLTGYESVPIQLAQCRFLGLLFAMIKYKYIFQVKYTEAISSDSTRKLLWFEISKMLIAV